MTEAEKNQELWGIKRGTDKLEFKVWAKLWNLHMSTSRLKKMGNDRQNDIETLTRTVQTQLEIISTDLQGIVTAQEIEYLNHQVNEILGIVAQPRVSALLVEAENIQLSVQA